MRNATSKRTRPILWLVAALIPAGALADLIESPHDFTARDDYPGLSALSDGITCAACHDPHGAQPFVIGDFGNDFPDGAPVVTDPDYTVETETGEVVGPRLAPTLPGAMACLGCHDGVIQTPFGTDTIPPESLANLNWTEGGAHNIWRMGQSSAYHPVQIHYPPEPTERMWEPFRTAPVAADHNIVQTADGTWLIVDPLITEHGLPLVTDPNDPGKAWITCITCHDPHGGSMVPAFLRLDWPDLCWMCHRRDWVE